MQDNDEKEVDTRYGNPTSSTFRLDAYPFYLIDRINSAFGVAMENVLRKHGIERAQWQVLLILREQSPSSITEISERSGRKLSTISRTIERMRNESLVKTAPRTSDQRVTDVFLIEAGNVLLEKLLTIASKQYLHAIKGFSDSELRGLTGHLQKILSNLGRSPYE